MRRESSVDHCVQHPSCTQMQYMVEEDKALIDVSQRSKYRECVWNFQNEYPSLPRYDVKLRFALTLNIGYLTDERHKGLMDSLKCLVYSLLFDPPHPRISITTIQRSLSPGHGIWHLYRFLANHNFASLKDLTKDDFSDLLEELCDRGNAKEITDRTLTNRVRGIDWVAAQSSKLKDGMSFAPWENSRSLGRWARTHASTRVVRGELSTQPWSDDLVRSMVSVALGIVSRAGDVEALFMQPEMHSDESTRLTRRLAHTRLRSAVAFLVSLFTGMRLKEVALIRSDISSSISVSEIRQGDRITRALFVNSQPSKRSIPSFESWQTIQVVHDAIIALSRVNSLISVDYEFLLHPSRFILERDKGRRLSAKVLMAAINKMAIEGGVDLCEVDWNISSLDFRRTFARLVTRKGLGVIELQTQLKHFDPDLSMQYGAPALREYILQEKQEYTKQQYQELLSGSERLIGGGAPELNEMRVFFSGLKRGAKQAFLESLPKDALIDQMADGLCRYRPHLALCGGNKLACRPADCKNSLIIASEFKKTVQFKIEENRRLLRLFLRSQGKRTHLKAQLALLEKLERQIDEKP